MGEAVRVLAALGLSIESIEAPVFDEERWPELVLLEEAARFDEELPALPPYMEYVRAGLRRKRTRIARRVAVNVDEMRRVYANLFSRFDLLVLPTTPITATSFETQMLP